MAIRARWGFVLLEVVIGGACCLSNASVIWAVWTYGVLGEPTFCFITFLAVADFLVGFVGIPLALLLDIHMEISFHGCLFMCCVLLMLQIASVVLLLTIAVDRCLRVRIPLTYKSTLTQKRSWILVALCWFTAAVWGFIPMFGWNNFDSLDSTANANSSCNTSFECSFSAVISSSYLVNFIFFSSLLTPLAIMTALYCYIFLTVRRRLRTNPGVAAESSTYYQKEHRLAASLALVLVLFAVCWLPLFLMHTVRFYGHLEVSSIAIDAGILLSHANSVFNPIVYAFKIPKIKEACQKLWVRLFHGREQQRSEKNKPQNEADSSTASNPSNLRTK